MSDNLVPEPQASVFDSVSKVLGDEEAARRVMANPQLAAGFPNGRPAPKSDGGVEMCACGRHPKSECEDGEHSSEDDIPLKAIDDIGRATAEDVKEALHQVIDPELGIDVIGAIAATHPVVLITVATANPFDPSEAAREWYDGKSGRRIPALLRNAKAAEEVALHRRYVCAALEHELAKRGSRMIRAASSDMMFDAFVRLVSRSLGRSIRNQLRVPPSLNLTSEVPA